MDSSPQIERYMDGVHSHVKQAYEVAVKAREKQKDPEPTVDIPLAKNLSERVEGLISVAVPQIKGKGLPQKIEEYENKFGKLDWRVAFSISLDVAKGRICEFKTQKEAMEAAIRVGLAYLTLGVVASPLEGFVELKLKKRKDNGQEYFALMFSGPIRSAGGTAGAVTVVLADYIRKQMGYALYDPTDNEIKRAATELYDYHDRVTNLQYLPSEKEVLYLAQHLPVQIDGDPSERIEVSNYKDLDRIDTNQIRSGVCLVMGECVAQKAKKVFAQLSKWGKDFDLEQWDFLKSFLDIQKQVKSHETTTTKSKEKVSPVYTFIADLVAGRPVLTHPLAHGGFRLRYGRCRTSGYSAASIHPATMLVLNDYIAVGTQVKVERPGKAATLTSCDTIEGPIVKLHSGDVILLDTVEKAKQYKQMISEILYLGDMLISFGDFFNRAHTLIPCGYCEEWWAEECKHALTQNPQLTSLSQEQITKYTKSPHTVLPSLATAQEISKQLSVPLHPRFTYHWNAISIEELKHLQMFYKNNNPTSQEKLILPLDAEAKRSFELLGVPHQVVQQESLVFDKEHSQIVRTLLGNVQVSNSASESTPLSLVNEQSPYVIRDKSGYFIGARMGRPEKAKMRKLTGSPQMLFPVGEQGGRMRSVQSALEAGKITAEISAAWVKKFNEEEKDSFIEVGEIVRDEYAQCTVHIRKLLPHLLKQANLAIPPDLIKGVAGTSNKEHIPEHPLKGVLRAKHDIYVNKDGTSRYDATQLPITHFIPKEIGTSVEKLKELGYEKDIYQNPLEHDDQILELKPQDIVAPACPDSPEEGADAIMFRTAKFIDELLMYFYNLKPFYCLENPKDLAGHLVMVLAPHTSAAIVGRIIGFSKTQGLFAHPMLHAATRRDCDGDEASISLLMDGLLNFSRQFLPNNRGATQDAPLVLTSKVVPSEVDDMIFDLDVQSHYDLEFYQACENYTKPWDVKVKRLGDFINTPAQYEGIMFTHNSSNMNGGVLCSSYKILPSMDEKLQGQMDIAQKIRAVDQDDVARLVIEKHLVRDIRGKLKKILNSAISLC